MRRNLCFLSVCLASSACLLFALGTREAAAAWGSMEEEDRTALLWVPEMNTVDWEALERVLEKHPDATLTLALSPTEVPEEFHALVKGWIEDGRLEVALRISGDPILPLLRRYRRRDAIDRIALGRTQFRQIFGRLPEGFVAGDGALTSELAGQLEKLGFLWAAVGDSVFRTPWYTEGSDPMIVIPFHVPASSHTASIIPEEGVRALVLSELGGALAPGGGAESLTILFEDSRNDQWTSASRAMAHMRPYAVGPEEWPPWSGEISLWTDHPLQEKAWKLYKLTVDALMRYQNSGSASLRTLNRATTSLYRAQNSRYYRVSHLRSKVMERKFRARLRRVFKIVGKKPPRAFLTPITYRGAVDYSTPGESPSEESSPEGAPDVPSEEGEVESGLEENSLFFQNPEGSSASLPETLPELPAGTTAEHLWTPRALRIRWDEESVILDLSVGTLREKKETPHGYEGLMLEVYMDLNHLAGRGATALLPGRRGFVRSLDAWEYAIIANSWKTGLYRAVPGQPPAFIESLKTEIILEEQTIRISVPRSRLRGNPAAWGYIFLALATDTSRAKRSPPIPLAGQGGSPLLGVLASLESQGKLATSKSSYRRLQALRLPDGS